MGKNIIRKKTTKPEIIQITDSIFPLMKTKRKSYKIKDHVNLSGCTFLTGPEFVPMNDIYVSSTKGITVAILKKGIHPNNKEKKILLKAGIHAYCYNLLETAELAALSGLKVEAIGVCE